MRVLVCEFVTGGGMRGEALPASLAREGAMMRDALVRDLADADADVIATHDDRTPPPPAGRSRTVGKGDDVWRIWAELAAEVDVAWGIAPETGDLLSRLTTTLRTSGARVIGPDDEAIAIASSKSRTAEILRAAGVATPPVWLVGEVPAVAAGPFVVKPDDGAGCEATRLLDRIPGAHEAPDGHVVQPYVSGDAASLTVLRADGMTRLLAANRQHVSVEDGVFRFRGLTVGSIDDADGRLAALAHAVCDALPGLDGVFGIDLVLSADGPFVIEINPRLTTAYCGLREALGQNPVLLVPPFAGAVRAAPARTRAVEVAL